MTPWLVPPLQDGEGGFRRCTTAAWLGAGVPGPEGPAAIGYGLPWMLVVRRKGTEGGGPNQRLTPQYRRHRGPSRMACCPLEVGLQNGPRWSRLLLIGARFVLTRVHTV